MRKRKSPLAPGTIVKTTQKDPSVVDWTPTAMKSRQWGVIGIIETHHLSRRLSYEVKHPDGTIGYYAPSEFAVIEKPKTRTVKFNTSEKDSGTNLRSLGWTSLSGLTSLECDCGVRFKWQSDKENSWIPDRHDLNYCPGCGNTIIGVVIPN